MQKPQVFVACVRRIPSKKKNLWTARGIEVSDASRGTIPDNWPDHDFIVSNEMLMTYINSTDQTRCGGQVDDKYFLEAMDANDIYLLQYYKVPREGRSSRSTVVKPGAFALCRVKGTSLYVDIICSYKYDEVQYRQHGGKHLLNLASVVCPGLGCDKVSLSALPTVLSYYPPLGFAHRRDCTVEQDPAITVAYSKIAQKKFATREAAYDDPDMLSYMFLLHASGFSSRKHADCDDKSIPPALLKKHDCAMDGYLMHKCGVRSVKK